MRTHVKLLSIAALVSCCTGDLFARQYFLAIDGNDKNTGSIESPFASLKHSLDKIGAGDTLFVRGGTYMQNERLFAKRSGTADARICVFAYADEKPVFDWSNGPQNCESDGRGIEHAIGANYWHYRGLEICFAGDNGMKMEGSFCVIEECSFHDCKDTGLQLGFGKGDAGENTRNPDYHYGRYNIILNCDSYNNYDPATNGGNADGFAVKLFPGPGNEFHGCRSWNNSDDGWDFYYVYFPIVVNNCWTLKNGYNKGNGNGFKMGGGKQGGDMSNGAHIFTNCISTDNPKKGFDQNNHDQGTYMINCVSARNGVNYGFNNAAPTYGEWVLYNCIGFAGGERNHQFNTLSTVKTFTSSWTDFDKCTVYNDRDKTANNGVTPVIPDYTSGFTSLSYEDAIAPRQANGNLPLRFGRITENSVFVDAGTVIEDFDAEDVLHTDYSKTVSLPYLGASADMGAFEYGITDNDYTLVMPENDGSVPDAEIEDPDAEFKDENGNIVYGIKTLCDWYRFDEPQLPDSIKSLISYAGNGTLNATLNPSFAVSSPALTGSTGAVTLGKSGCYIQFDLPSLSELSLKLYMTGTRDLTVMYGAPGRISEWKTVTKMDIAKGNYTVDITSMASDMKSKSPVCVRVINSKSSGDLHVTDANILSYYKLDGTSVKESVAEKLITYITGGSVIVYGDIASIKVYSTDGRLVSHSYNMQVADISNLPSGSYILRAATKDGKVQVEKFTK